MTALRKALQDAAHHCRQRAATAERLAYKMDARAQASTEEWLQIAAAHAEAAEVYERRLRGLE